MKRIHCVTARFEGIKAGAYEEKGLSRIRADGRALFTQAADFTEPDCLARIPAGTDVYMGVQAFPDGTFWMHWLHAPGLATAEQPASGSRAGSGALLLVCGVGLFLLGLLPLVKMTSVIVAMIGCLILLGGVFAVCKGVHSLLLAASGRTRRLQAWLEAVKAGDTGMAVPLKTFTDDDPEDGGLSEMLEDMEESAGESGKALYQAEGPVSHVTAMSIVRGAGKYKQYFIEYTFMCAGRFVSLTIGEDTPMLHALFLSRHPFMLAEGDRVRLIVGEDTRTVKAMRNFEDGCAYWLTGAGGGFKLKKALKWLLLFPFAVPLLFVLFGLMDNGYIDWGMVAMAFGLSAASLAGLVVLLWLILAAVRHFGSYRADLPVIIDALELHPAQNKAKPYIHEL